MPASPSATAGGSVASRRDAQERADRLQIAREEVARLEADGVLRLSEEQRRALNDYVHATVDALHETFDIDTSISQKQVSRGVRIVATLGGLASCAALMLLFLQYWGFFPTWAQVAFAAAAPAAVLCATLWLAGRERTYALTALVAMVAFAAFVLNLVVLGSIFNVTSSQRAFLAWGTFALLLAYAFALRPLLLTGLVCIVIYVSASITQWRGYHWLAFAERPEVFILIGAGIAVTSRLPHPRLPEFPPVYRAVGLATLLGTMLVLTADGSASALPLPIPMIEAGYELAALATAITAVWLGLRRQTSEVVSIGSTAVALLLFMRLYDWWWEWLPKYVFFLAIGLSSIALVALLTRLRKRLTGAA